MPTSRATSPTSPAPSCPCARTSRPARSTACPHTSSATAPAATSGCRSATPSPARPSPTRSSRTRRCPRSSTRRPASSSTPTTTRPGGGIYYLNNGYAGIRAGRITALLRAELAGDGSVSFADSQRIQADTALVDAQYFVPHLVKALARGALDSDPTLRGLARNRAVAEAVGRLAIWNRRTPTGIPEGYDASDPDGQRQPPTRLEQLNSVAATIYAVWRSQLIQGAIDARLAPYGVAGPDGERSLTALKHLLESFGQTRGVGASGSTSSPSTGLPTPPTAATSPCSGPCRPPWPSCPAPTSRPPSAGRPTRTTTAGAACTGSLSTTPWAGRSTSS